LFYAAKKQVIPVPLVIPAILLFLIGAWLVRVGRKMSGMVDVEHAILFDGRRPVLYLRSFSADGQSHFADITNAIVPESDEENLRDLFADMGLLVAIGRPGERLPEAGALRLYCGDNDWQSVVIRYLHESQIVIMRAGTSNAILWEIRRATEYVAPQDLLFFVPRSRWFGVDEYAVFRRNVKKEFNWDLPAGLKFPSWVGFGEGWEPRAFEFAPTGFVEKHWPHITRSNVWVWRQVLLPWLDSRAVADMRK